MLFLIDGRKIIKFLFDNKITVKKFAEIAGVSVQAARNAAEGKKLRIPSIAKIAEFMKVTPNDLIVGSEV